MGYQVMGPTRKGVLKIDTQKKKKKKTEKYEKKLGYVFEDHLSNKSKIC